ncbi:hypothetical protein R4M06_08930 [Brachyspira pilosicoli]|uniref:hypothetical protein n=1 Tax=Brachyspira pilosicoli TaxID=52584 RepID=UPI0030057241
MNKDYSNGQKCEISGQYKVKGENREITMVAGNTFPPSPDGKDVTYILVDVTKHKK